MNALLHPRGNSRRAMSVRDLGAVVAIENRAYGFPWTRGNFVDALAAGYIAEVLLDEHDAVIAYFVAMTGVDEVHLLNVTVAPDRQRRGHGTALLDAVAACARRLNAASLWLEVRTSNTGARSLYERLGYTAVGVRRGYYPAAAGREDAIVMRLALSGPGSDALV